VAERPLALPPDEEERTKVDQIRRELSDQETLAVLPSVTNDARDAVQRTTRDPKEAKALLEELAA
jgi:hypothetical protein